MSLLKNATRFLTTLGVYSPPYDATACHSCVLDFQQLLPGVGTWGGYRFWMGTTTDGYSDLRGATLGEDVFIFVSNQPPGIDQQFQPAPQLNGTPILDSDSGARGVSITQLRATQNLCNIIGMEAPATNFSVGITTVTGVLSSDNKLTGINPSSLLNVQVGDRISGSNLEAIFASNVVSIDEVGSDYILLDYYADGPYVGSSFTWNIDRFGTYDESGSSDDDLVYDPGRDVILLYSGDMGPSSTGVLSQRVIHKSGSSFYVTGPTNVTFDGVNYTDHYNSPLGGGSSIIRLSANDYLWWGCKAHDDRTGDIIFARSIPNSADPSVTFGPIQICTPDIMPLYGNKYYPWHIQAKINPFIAGQVDLVISCHSSDVKAAADPFYAWADMPLIHAITTVDNPTVLSSPLAPVELLKGSGDNPLGWTVTPASAYQNPTVDYIDSLSSHSRTWDYFGCYRSSFTLVRCDESGVDNPAGSHIKINVWYTGLSYPGDTPNVGVGYIAKFGDRLGFTSGVLCPVTGFPPPTVPNPHHFTKGGNHYFSKGGNHHLK